MELQGNMHKISTTTFSTNENNRRYIMSFEENPK